MHPIEVLEKYWNHTSFRPLQEDIIDSVLHNNDTFALLPTGGGKSVCFQIPALIKDGICIVISPLVSLMKDQVNTLKQKGIKAIALPSGIAYQDLDIQLNNCIYGNYKFLYLSPERLLQPIVQERIQQMNVNLIAVDEAHCISQWGNDFRPAYKNIVKLRELHPHINCIALTATAKTIVINEIISALDFVDAKPFKASYKRANITYSVIQTEDKKHKLIEILETHKGAAIVYVRNRKATIELSNYLNLKGFETAFFHGGLTTTEKAKRLNAWTVNKTPIIVATTAFGMGIDKPDVKTVIHYNLPESLESYYQEAGRAGRNGANAYAILLKTPVDEAKLKSQFLSVLPNIEFVKHIYKKLCAYFHIAYGEGQDTLHQLNFKDFCDTYGLKKSKAYNALFVLDRNSIIRFNHQFTYKTTVQFLISNKQIFNYLEKNKANNSIIKALLRTYGGIFDYPTKINTELIASKSNTSEMHLLETLNSLEKQNIIDLKIANTDSEITFIKPREDEKTIHPIKSILEQQYDLKKRKIDAVIKYSNEAAICRAIQLLNYFDEKEIKNCDTCDVCLSRQKDTSLNFASISAKIIAVLKQQEASSRQLQKLIKCDEKQLITVITKLLETDILKITSKNTYILK